MFRFPFIKKTFIAFALSLLIFILIGLFSYQTITNLTLTNKWVNHTYSVLQKLENILAHTLDIETGTRGYLLSKDEKFLEPYLGSSQIILQEINQLKEETKDNVDQQKNINDLNELVNLKVETSKKLNHLNETNQLNEDLKLKLVNEGKLEMDQIRRLIQSMKDIEYFLLENRLRNEQMGGKYSEWFVLTGNITAILLLSFSTFLLYRSFLRERKSEEKNAQLAQLVEYSADAIIGKDLNGTILSWNLGAEKLYGYQPNEVIGKSISIIIPAELIVQFSNIMKELQEGKNIQNLETIRIAKSGKQIPVLLTVSPIKNLKGEVIGASSIARDITEKKRIDKMKDEFISTVSHELRTPLTSIRGALGLITTDLAGKTSKQTAHLLEIGMKNCERLIRLINDILDIEKIESQKVEFKLQPVEINALIQKIIDESEPLEKQYQIQFSIQKSIEPITILSNADALSQVIINLISNAVKFSYPNQKVKIKIERLSSAIQVSVTNRGNSIPKEFSERVFKKFSQADSSDTRQKGGTGLGLSICKAIIEKLGGKITFESNNETTFYFSLPINPQPNILENREASIQSEKEKVLIYDNDQDVALLLEQILKRDGYQPVLTHSVTEAIRFLQSDRYKGMTIDLILPGEDGYFLLHSVRSDQKTKDLPVVVVTEELKKDREKLSKYNVSEILNKPIDPEKLLQAFHRVTRKDDSLPTILYVEDDRDITQVITQLLDKKAIVLPAKNIKEAEDKIRTENFDLVLLDLILPDGDGAELIKTLQSQPKKVPVIVYTSKESVDQLRDRVAKILIKSKSTNEELLSEIQKNLKRNRSEKEQLS